MRKIDWLLDAVDRLMEMVCHLLLVGIIAVTALQVALRFLFNSPTSWSEEVALLMLVWFGMIAIAIGIRRHGHIAITTLRDRLPLRLGRGVDFLAEALLVVFSLVLLWQSFALIGLAGVQVMPATGLSRAWLYYPVLVGGALMSVNGLFNLAAGRVAPARPELAQQETPGHE